MIASVIKIRVKIWLCGKAFQFKIEEKVVTEEAAATAEESKPHVLEKIQSAIEKKMEKVNTTYSDPMFSEELINTIIARGLRHNGREMVMVESLNNEPCPLCRPTY